MLKGAHEMKSQYYNDETIFKKELETLFTEKFLYLGSASQLARPGFQLIRSLGQEKILTSANNEFHLMDNSCRHRHSRLISGDVSGAKITCPVHRWSYNGRGECISVPFDPGADKTNLALKKNQIHRFGDMLFSGKVASQFTQLLAELPNFKELRLDQMLYSSRSSEVIQCNWKNYIEIFAENYHVPFVHPGFSQIVDIDKLDWQTHPDYCVQNFKMNQDLKSSLQRTTSQYRNWIQRLDQYFQGKWPETFGSLILFYPNLIIECYPLTTAVGWIEPLSTDSFRYQVDYYHDARMLREAPEIAQLAEIALNQTESEDKSICEDLALGRMNDSAEQADSFYVKNLEVGVEAFYEYYLSKMNLEPVS